MSKMKCKRLCVMLTLSLLLVCMMGTTAFAAGTGDVAGAVESTWATASTQIKTVVNNVVFPAIDLILAVFFFAKLGTAYFDYRKSGQFEWTAPAILFACLVFTLTARTGASEDRRRTVPRRHLCGQSLLCASERYESGKDPICHWNRLQSVQRPADDNSEPQ